MEGKHPIDERFRDGLNNVDIPFDEGAWTTLSRKMHPRRRWPLLIVIGSGMAAALVIAAILLFGERELPTADPKHQVAALQIPVIPTPPAAPTPTSPPTSDAIEPAIAAAAKRASQTAITPRPTEVGSNSSTATLPPVLTHVQSQQMYIRPQQVATNGTITEPLLPPPPISSKPAEEQRDILPDRTAAPRWSLGIMAAPDLSGTQPFRGKLSGNVGLLATYRLNGRVGISAGVLYAKKLYQADFADYGQAAPPSYSQYAPVVVDADCNVLDIPVNINVDIVQQQHATWFASTGISSYLMLKETYDYTYPPHQYGDLKQLTLYNQNRHIFGVANLSVGYRRQLGGAVSVTVQPFVKVPLTGIGNGKLKLFSSGVALSADIDLTRRTKLR